MGFKRAPIRCYAAYYVLFGTLSGWCLGIAMSPSGLAATCMIFLTTIAPLSCLISSIVLQVRGGRTRLEEVAIISGYIYPVLLIALFISAQIYYGLLSKGS
jgi:hypothetical protein